jgi:hypothetical protein
VNPSPVTFEAGDLVAAIERAQATSHQQMEQDPDMMEALGYTKPWERDDPSLAPLHVYGPLLTPRDKQQNIKQQQRDSFNRKSNYQYSSKNFEHDRDLQHPIFAVSRYRFGGGGMSRNQDD